MKSFLSIEFDRSVSMDI